ncbi:hypothetical protein SELMODRAFT_405995 [Selaginella moellendorffii]|uniref:Uncharacterized protein n=1 Tax=Selaginella moellendorffii TaxID=88036 RepID=D8R0B6_SELML|nr:hypothetical protein SELMODRAFT_405995 [Selaginella moellendorffii]
MDAKFDFDASVIEVFGTGALKTVAISGRVFAFDLGGGGGAVPLAAEAACGKVDEFTEEVIGSIVAGSTIEAVGGIVATPTTPKASGAGGASGGNGIEWPLSFFGSFMPVGSKPLYVLNLRPHMAIYSSFAKVKPIIKGEKASFFKNAQRDA